MKWAVLSLIELTRGGPAKGSSISDYSVIYNESEAKDLCLRSTDCLFILKAELLVVCCDVALIYSSVVLIQGIDSIALPIQWLTKLINPKLSTNEQKWRLFATNQCQRELEKRVNQSKQNNLITGRAQTLEQRLWSLGKGIGMCSQPVFGSTLKI